ncbi:MYG1 family protein (plasmid) [Thioclava litoralis]|uniref:MYG1 family protein n=1 Tax=Thioclava litoralis TaxID=3076557 RepID=A0ABZ1E6G7_9RHOB|nr:MYG1 family protein [Thioclava sp. FTW29]
MTITHLVTHSGGFHADEVFSTVVLTRLFPQAELVRTRDPQWLVPAEGRVIYDVGGDFDPARNIYDHHQREAPVREDGAPLSSFGLVWAQFGRDYLRSSGVPEAHLDEVHDGVDRSFVQPVDLVDNGKLSPGEAGALQAMTLPGLIETLRPVFDDKDPEGEIRTFWQAVGIARAFLEARVARSAAKLRAAGMVAEAIVAAGEGRILELPTGMPFRPAVVKAGADQLWFVVTPRGPEDWTLGTIRKFDEGFENRADLPAAWAGLNGVALEEASGVKGAKFCHNGRFIAAANSREAVMGMARLAVEDALARGVV